MRAGRLDRTITLQRQSEIVSSAGTVTATWTDFAVLRAELLSNLSAEVARAYGEGEGADMVFRIRHYHGLTTKDRVVYAGQSYGISAIVQLGRRRAMELRCKVAP
ncbi:phage head closure protein [Devosia sp. MC532]|uniref:phage head closure protein n=1 Tax=Devosia sp. MC532 TaxID=2799788 RepID=UPI0018F2FB09|nr:phage head closure protein [Devosia sp. MC532]MBJ7578147.1 phage head closure protein [Devosia sp. MC532]